MPGFRARQILEWVYDKKVADPARMTNLPARDRQTLAEGMTFLSADILAHQVATDATQKLLMQWRQEGDPPPSRADADTESTLAHHLINHDATPDPSRQTECVMIPATDDSSRKTACISSQVGCPVGCRFCASGLGGLDGNLTTGRIVEQAWLLSTLPNVGRISNIVFMGMGEPLANFAAVMGAVRRLAAPTPEGMGISARKITVSTVGMHKAIERLADQLELPITLALSLHAPNDELRRRLIPWAEFTTIDQLLAACSAWFKKTGREITLEYILLGGVNDQPEHARQLASLARSLRANVNLIRYNEVRDLEFKRPTDNDVRTFQALLRDNNVNAHIRASRGRDIAAACGQLRHEHAHSGTVPLTVDGSNA